MLTWLKRISWDWLPLSGMIMIFYMFQRGFASLSKAGIAGIDLAGGLSIYFYVVALGALVIGLLADRMKPTVMVGLTTVLGVIGLMCASNPWLFGIGAGLAAAAVKIITFSIPLNNKTTDVDALRVAPQASAKNIGSALFTSLLAGVITAVSFNVLTGIMAGVLLLCGFLSVKAVEKHNFTLLQWKLADVWYLLKSWKLWVYGLWYTTAGVFLYTCMTKVIPAFMNGLSMSKAEAAGLFGSLTLASCLLRWPAAWLGDKMGHWTLMLMALTLQGLAALMMYLAPLYGAGLYFVVFSVNTPNMWACAKRWFGPRIGTAMGMVFVVCYIGMGFMFGLWSK